MAAHASHPLAPHPSPAPAWRPLRIPARRRRDVLAEAIEGADARTAWKPSIAFFGAVSVTGLAALLLGLDTTGPAQEIVTAGASAATGVLGHLAPRPPASEPLRPARGEAF